MDLFAYTQIVDLQAIADRNGISVPRCRGYRLMKNEERVTMVEIEQMITEQALYEAEKLFRLHPSGLFYEYSDRAKARARRYIVIRKNENGFDEPMAVCWDRVHGKRRKAVKRVFKQVRRDVKEQYTLFNSLVGRENVLYIHARLGSTSWTDEKIKAEVTRQPWFLAKVDDSFDSSYCDIYARIGREETDILRAEESEHENG